uniref:Uncharacterized protein n=1 Tax=Chlorocebus sabaeus TaxID=60711 RepID=A0A0D9S214_CHLSB
MGWNDEVRPRRRPPSSAAPSPFLLGLTPSSGRIDSAPPTPAALALAPETAHFDLSEIV